MPDSQVTPPWGLAYDERDLDALLSGQTGSTPTALQPVEQTLAALRAPATGPELSDEAVARAAFRAFAPARPDATGPNATTSGAATSGAVTSGAVTSANGPLPWAVGAEPAAVTSRTLVLFPADGRPRRPARHRHRHRRPAEKSARKPRIAVTGAAAAALVVVAVVAGALTGSIGELTSFGRQPASPSASAHATAGSPGSEGTLVTSAASEPAQSPEPTVSAARPTPLQTPSPESLCRQYFADAPPGPGDQGVMASLYTQLSKLARSPSPARIYEYCFHYLDNQFEDRGAMPSGGAPAAGSGPTAQATTGSASSGGGTEGSQPSGTSGQAQGASAGSGAGAP